METNEFLDAALAYAAHGWAVFPCRPRGKQPLTEHGVNDATRDPGQIREWWRRWPSANIGLATGEDSAVDALDVDPAHQGEESLMALLAEHGALPVAPVSLTGGGGKHYLFAHVPGVRNSTSRIGAGLDVRGDGGYIIVPPSVHPSGVRYTWQAHPDTITPAPWPEWLLARLRQSQTAGGDRQAPPSDHIPEGERNNALTRLAGSMRRMGATEDAIRAALLLENSHRCQPALRPDEVERIAASVARYPAAAPASSAPPDLLPPEREEQSGAPAGGQDVRGRSAVRMAPKDDWPDALSESAFYGVAGDLVRTIEPHTEADPAAVLIQFLAGFGNLIGRNAYFRAEADRHYPNLFVSIVGKTAKGRKGTSWGRVKERLIGLDGEWEKRVLGGLSSGEGLIWSVRDPIEKQKLNKDTKQMEPVVIDEGVEDKRLLCIESELASVLRVIAREGNTLSAIMREAWDSGNLNSLVKNSPATATDAHISVVGHITADELRRYLDRTEIGNGFANRFLWLCVRRSKELPEGGGVPDWGGIPSRLAAAVQFGRQKQELRRDAEAAEVWRGVYHRLSQGLPGLLGAVTSRAEAQTMRLALLYAILDCSPVIRCEHLLAGLAVWEYAAESARVIFGDSTGDPVSDEIRRALRNAPEGLTRTQLRDLFGRNRSSDEIARALGFLLGHGLARSERRDDTGGRPAELWFAASPATQ